jgi:BlaI family penicillinase repressor
MERLTRAEEELMLLFWAHGPCTVTDLIDQMPAPKPPHSSVSTIVRILEKKGYVGHEETGRSFTYFALLEKSNYAQGRLGQITKHFFGSSAKSIVSHLVKNDDLKLSELQQLLDDLKKAENDKLK